MAINMMELLAAELNMHAPHPEARVTQLNTLLDVAASKIKAKGIHLLPDDAGDIHLQVEYAAWMYRRRVNGTAAIMPRYLDLDIKDRLIHEKGGVSPGG